MNGERHVAEPRKSEDFLFLGPQLIASTVVILMVTMASYGALVHFLNSLGIRSRHAPHLEACCYITVGVLDPKTQFYKQL